MAELKNGSTVGGNLIHHSGNSGTPQTNWYARDLGLTNKLYFFAENTYNGEKVHLSTTGGASEGTDKAITIKNSNGYLTIGPVNTSHCHYYTDKPSHYFNRKIHVAGDISASGTYYLGDDRKIIQFDDTWLRLNPDNHFSQGIFCGSSVVRTDGQLQVGDSGNKFKVESTGKTTIAGETTVNNSINVTANINVGNKSGDNYSTFKHITSNGYGFTFQHGTASVIVNEQGGKTQAIVVGDNDNNNTNTLFGVSHSDNGSTWVKKLNLTAAGELYLGQTGTTRAFHDTYHPNADKLTTARSLTVTLTGDATGSNTQTFDGTANKTFSVPVVVADNSHNHTSLTDVTTINFKADGTDAASIGTTISGSTTYMDFNLRDDTTERWRWRFGTADVMVLSPISTSAADLTVTRNVVANGESRANILNTRSDTNLSIRRNGQERVVLHSSHTEVKNILQANSGISIGDSSDHIAAATLKGSDSNINQDGVDSSGELQVQYDGCAGTRAAVRAGIFRAHHAVYAKAMNFHSGDSKIDRRAGIEYNSDTNSIDFVFA